MRRQARAIVTGVVTGFLFVGSVWAGVGLKPVDEVVDRGAAKVTAPKANKVPSLSTKAFTPTDLGTGEVLVGAAKISLEPQPPTPEAWVRDREACTPATSGDLQATGDHIADWRSPWIENTGCIYMGGYGIGPSNPILSWDKTYDLWVRSTVMTDAQGDTLVLTLLDAEGYFGEYNKMCGPAVPRCGAFQLADDMAAKLGIKPDGFIIASTHAHTAMDFIGGWGGVPPWYMDQVAQSIKDSIEQAWDNRVPATIEGGESMARGFNGERRTHYRSAEDPTVNWIRALDRSGAVVATVGTFATHPVNYDADHGIGHGDFPPVFAAELESKHGGVASLFQAGLGNMTGGGNWETKGKGIANRLPAPGSGTLVDDPNIRVAREFWNQPVTNVPLGSLGAGGFFDRPFSGPASIQAGKSTTKNCKSAAPVSARVNVVAAKIGSVVVTSAPGEIFANYSNTIEERSPITGLAIGQANDALGYMPQSFETDHAARQGTGFVARPVAEYEDAYSIDACFGDMALETTIKLLNGLPAS